MTTQTTDNNEELRAIDPREVHVFKNPRRRINEASPTFQDFLNSVKAKGVIQSILVAPREDGGYWLIAGERRVRASLLADLSTIPAIVKNVSKEEAFVLATIENTQREDLSPIEEAEAARTILDYCDGDREEAMRRLAWPAHKFERRLPLVHATDAVREAFHDGKIALGHVELLATLPALTQEGTLGAIIEKQTTVADLKARLTGRAQPLKTAIFETGPCADCHHNSSKQASLFESHIDAGFCTNWECYGQKTRAALEAKKTSISSQYNVVFLDVEKSPGTYGLVTANGIQKVGPKQFAACKGCGHFGALLISEAGRVGHVVTDQCFNLECRKEKVEAYQAGQKANEPPTAPAAAKKSGGAAAGATKAAPAGKPPKAAKPGSHSIPRKVIDKTNAFYRELGGAITLDDAKASRAVALHALFRDGGMNAGKIAKKHLGATLSSDLHVAFPVLYALGDTVAAKLQSELAADYIATKGGFAAHGSEPEIITAAKAVIRTTKIPLEGRFKLDADFLSAHTKAGIESVLSEANNAEGTSFPDWYNAQKGKDNAFRKLVGQNVGPLVKEVMRSGFDFSKFVPSCVSDPILHPGRSKKR